MDQQPALARLLASYPRTRPPLTSHHQRSYLDHYRANRSGAGWLGNIVQSLESWMHRKVALTKVALTAGERLLEIGAGTLNHLRYHPSTVVYDAVEPFRELWESSPALDRIRTMYADISEIPSDSRYDHIVSVAVLEHLTDLPLVLARSALLLRSGGTFRAGFPSEGGLLWGLSWRTTTGLAYRLKRGLDYGVIMRHEHVNTAAEIVSLLRYFYRHVDLQRFPLPAKHLSFYTAAISHSPRLERCQAVCDERLEAVLRTSASSS